MSPTSVASLASWALKLTALVEFNFVKGNIVLVIAATSGGIT